ncbi:MAG: hypothetical protein V3T33_10020 [Myxococcota bacterium]
MTTGATDSAGEGAPDRAAVWKCLGEPTDQQGSVNDPRTRQDQGHTWNEKWIYLAEDGRATLRVVLWNRYDFVGLFRIDADGSLQPEPLPEK